VHNIESVIQVFSEKTIFHGNFRIYVCWRPGSSRKRAGGQSLPPFAFPRYRGSSRASLGAKAPYWQFRPVAVFLHQPPQKDQVFVRSPCKCPRVCPNNSVSRRAARYGAAIDRHKSAARAVRTAVNLTCHHLLPVPDSPVISTAESERAIW